MKNPKGGSDANIQLSKAAEFNVEILQIDSLKMTTNQLDFPKVIPKRPAEFTNNFVERGSNKTIYSVYVWSGKPLNQIVDGYILLI